MFKNRIDKGFTLVEVLIALIIFTSISLVSIAYYGFGQKEDVRSKKYLYALKMAEDKIEYFKSLPYSWIAGSVPTTHEKYGTIFTRHYGSSELIRTNDRFKVVSITITWASDGGPQENVNLFTIVASTFN